MYTCTAAVHNFLNPTKTALFCHLLPRAFSCLNYQLTSSSSGNNLCYMFLCTHVYNEIRKYVHMALIPKFRQSEKENERVYRICKIAHGSHYQWQYFQLAERSKNVTIFQKN